MGPARLGILQTAEAGSSQVCWTFFVDYFFASDKQFLDTRVDDGIWIVQIEWFLLGVRMLVLMMVTVMSMTVVVVVTMAGAQILVFAVLQLVRRIEKETCLVGNGSRQCCQVNLFAGVQIEGLSVLSGFIFLGFCTLPVESRFGFGDGRVTSRAARMQAIAAGRTREICVIVVLDFLRHFVQRAAIALSGTLFGTDAALRLAATPVV